MTQDEYVAQLEKQVDPVLVQEFKDWPVESKMYMYIHNIQLAHMAEFKKMLMEHKHGD